MSDDLAASSAAAAEVAVPQEVEHLNDADYNNWRKTGDLPVKAKDEAPPTSEPVDANKTAVEKKADSGTAKRQRPDQERNWKALRERAEKADKLEKEIADLRAKYEKPDAESLPAKTSFRPEPEAPKRPSVANFNGTPQEFDAAMDKYETDKENWRAEKSTWDSEKAGFEKFQARQSEKLKAINESFQAIGKKGFELYGQEKWLEIIKESVFKEQLDIDEPLHIFFRSLEPETAAPLLPYFNRRQDDLKRIMALKPLEQMEELKALVAAMRSELGDKGSEAKSAPKREVTNAKRPPNVIGGQNTNAGADEEAEVLKKAAAGDEDATTRYINLANARDIAKRKTGR